MSCPLLCPMIPIQYVSFLHWLMLGQLDSPQLTIKKLRSWCMPKLSLTLKKKKAPFIMAYFSSLRV